uniref:G-protein coupled receptors family 3 profile domain-containing protein n=1 Tax=Poecilia mexicana TaxID=48701 RepID=A0A3B3XGH8_9TELE
MNTGFGCELLGNFDMPSLFKEGDIMIGGIFPVFNKDVSSIATFDGEPPAVTCAFDLRAFRWAQMMIFAIEEVNTDPALLPNISLGYRILNSCSSPTNTLRAALTLASSQNEKETASGCSPPISAVIAEAGSSQSLAVAGILGPFQVAVVSYFSTCACLSNRVKYPTFFRTIPSDYFQAKALAALVKHFGWEWIGAIQSDNDYGRNGVLAFAEEVKKLKICIAFIGTVLRTYPLDKILKVVEMIKQSTVKVILAFVPEGDFYPLMKEIVKQNITGIQWIASEAWITAARPSTPEMYRAFGGALGFVVQKMDIPNLNPFLMNINPYRNPSEPFVKDFWEIMVGCKPSSNVLDTGAAKICLGNETLMDYTQDVFFNVSQLRVAYNVYKAVYTIAHALHQLVFCRPAAGGKNVKPCLNVSEIHPREVTYHLQRVNFRNRFGDDVFFDENGNPPASYDVINWQLRNGQVQHVTLGHFTSTKNGEFTLSIQEDRIVWRTGQMVPASVCSNACPAGTRKAQIKGKPVCCFDCVPCAEGSIANSQFGPIQQRIIVCSCTLVQVIICILWLKLNPPFPDRVFKYSSKKIVLECNTGSEVAFYAVLGYIGILSVICLILAFLARKLPDNFNEAKCITFSMLIFCAVWITFIPAYVSSPGKFTVAVEIFAILSSAFGLLISIFAPKCYIILVKPEKNTKKYVMRL